MQTEVSNLRDDELLGLIRRRHEDPDSAGTAFLELYKRHIKYLLWVVERAGNFVGRGLTAEDIVEQTFSEVYLKAAASFEPGNYQCDADAQRHVRAWLGRVAHYEFLGAIQSRAHEFIEVGDADILTLRADRPHFHRIDETRLASDDGEVSRVAEAVLNPDELEIVWLKMSHYNPETGESWVPAKELELVCTKQGISKEVFRKRYERALNKVKEALVARDKTSKIYNRRN